MENFAYLQHRESEVGPFLAERVRLRLDIRDGYKHFYRVYYMGNWRRVYTELRQPYIIYNKTRIRVNLNGKSK
jgi:hypothetical protein